MEITLYKYCNPYKNTIDEQSFIICDKYITIKQNKSKGIGNTFWDCVYSLL